MYGRIPTENKTLFDWIGAMEELSKRKYAPLACIHYLLCQIDQVDLFGDNANHVGIQGKSSRPDPPERQMCT
jgi:hypothetical protein